MTYILRRRLPDMRLVASARLAAASMVWDGRCSPAARRYLRRCLHYDPVTGTSVCFTRESGYHSSGWWKNPDFDRCFHLSISSIAFEDRKKYVLPLDMKMAQLWVEAFFGDDARLTWHEGPYSRDGKAHDVHHYRLFCDPAWQPIRPRGEVYSKDWTPSDWRSFSDIHNSNPAP